VRGQDGELLQASSDLLRREDDLLRREDEQLLCPGELLWRCRSGWCCSGREGSSSAAEGRSRSGPEGLVATLLG
jgi:hypothetical protein